MLSSNALRHQMVLPEQQSLYDYWRSKCHNGRLPSRDDINPVDIHSHLPMISLIQVEKNGTMPRFQYRLAGTGFWDLFDEEVQGRYVDELPFVQNRGIYWQRVLTQVTSTHRPTVGMTRPGTPLGAHLAQFWIRLPLSNTGQNVDLILGYDHLVKMPEMKTSDTIKAAQQPVQALA